MIFMSYLSQNLNNTSEGVIACHRYESVAASKVCNSEEFQISRVPVFGGGRRCTAHCDAICGCHAVLANSIQEEILETGVVSDLQSSEYRDSNRYLEKSKMCILFPGYLLLVIHKHHKAH